MSQLNLNDALSAIDIQADWVGLREVKESTTYRIIRDGNPQANSRDIDYGVMVEVLAEGQFGYYGCNNTNPANIQKAAEKALQQAKASAKNPIFEFTTEARPVTKGNFQSPFKQKVNDLSAGRLNEIMLKAYNQLKVNDQIVSAHAMAMIIETESNFVSSNGSDVQQSFLMVQSDYSAMANKGDIYQRRTDNHCLQIGMEEFDEDLVLARAQRVGEQALELLDAEDCPTDTTNLVLAPDQMMLQIHESVGHALEVDRILGDERNYAGWSFVREADFGKLQYGSKIMNITFDPTVDNQFACYGYDDGGLKAERDFIIKDGLLVKGLGGKESQLRSGLPGVANFRASSWNRAPIDRMANLNLEPGESTFDEIIAAVDHGVYMETNRSWSIDDYRNKFQFGCEYGKLIENGKLTKTVKNPNYRAISNPFWNSLKMLGNSDTFEVYGTPYCGKGEPNQAIRVGHASPVCLFENVEIFGGV
ncbi:MAG: TldD/PmbA family protein [Candidatus Marinimicrobia bacterium]|nr:TldD/PmbA family protein [Candidatus Neomarinimicrobiota bacterium]